MNKKIILFFAVLLFSSFTASGQDLTISSVSDWNTFASAVSNGTSYEGKTVKLANDISVTTMVGTSDHPFKGLFDGNGKTLTVNINGTEAKCAPFHFINGATIKYLRVAGSITSTRSNSAGIIGEILGGTVSIENCISSVTITNNMDATDKSRNNAGLVGRMAAGNVIIENCLFNGDLHQGNSDNPLNAGMLGWVANGSLEFRNCLFNPSGITMNHSANNDGKSYTYFRGKGSTMTNCYYTVLFGERLFEQPVGDMTNEQLVAVLGDGWLVKKNEVVPVMPINPKNLDDAIVNGLSSTYLWKNGSAITISYAVAAGDATPLTEGTHYTSVIKKDNVVVSEITEVGDYTLTIAAKDGSGYTGSKTWNFSVINILDVLSVDDDFVEGQDGYYYVNMPSGYDSKSIVLGEGFTSSFKVYDDGGKNNFYSYICRGVLVMTAPNGYVLQLSGNVTTCMRTDFLTVYDGNSTNAPILLNEVQSFPSGCTNTIPTVISSGQSMTLYFESGYNREAGLDLLVKLIKSVDHNITVNTATGGSVTCDKSKASPGETVTLTVGSTSNGYMLRDIKIEYGNNKMEPIKWDGMSDNSITFRMPSEDVSVTPIFTNKLTADNGLFVNVPASGNSSFDIPNNVTSFKVYDNGGKSVSYSNNCNGSLKLCAPNGYVLHLLPILTTEKYDYLTVYDGDISSNSKKLLDNVYCNSYGFEQTFSPIVSSGQSMTINFVSDRYYTFAGLDFTVIVSKSGSALSSYIIRYNKNCDDASGTMAVQTHNYNASLALTANAFQRTGYTFGGWATSAEGDVKYADKATVKNLATENVPFVELFAKWRKNLTNTDITIAVIPDQTYTGSAIKPEIEVKDGETTLTLGTDYTVEYSNNTITGTATATITGKGNYSGERKVSFSIVPKETTLGALTLAQDQNGYTATLNGNYTADATPVSIPSDISVNSVTINRTFQSDVTSTIILPFGVESGKYSGGTFYEFTSVDYKNGKWEASMTKVTGKIEAHKPYLFKPSGDKLTISGGVTLKATSDQEYSDTKGDWTFNGVFKVKNWATGVKRDYFFASTAATSTEGNAVSAGDFVRIGNECGLSPFRCYLSYTGDESSLTKSEKQLPTSIEVRLIDEVSSVVEPGNPDPLNPDDPGAITTPVSEITTDSGVKVWSFNRTIYIASQPGTDYKIVDLSGRTIKNGVTRSTREEVTLSRATGIVIVKVNGKTFKINY